jgi:hypothetical protein
MPDQKEHEKVENLVESSPELAEKAARTLEQAANSNQSLEGFQAINNERITPELEREAREDDGGGREKGHPVP